MQKVIIIFIFFPFLCWGQQTLVEVYPVTSSVIQDQVKFSGHLQAIQHKKIYSKVSGQLSELFAKTGDHIKSGERLASIDNGFEIPKVKEFEIFLYAARIDVEHAEMTIKTALIHVEQLKLKTDHYHLALKDAKNKVSQLKNELSHNQKNLKRAQRLLKSRTLSSEEYEKVVVKYEKVKTATLLAKSQIAGKEMDLKGIRYEQNLAKLNLRNLQLVLEKAKLALEKAKLALNNQRMHLENYNFYAPISGVVVVYTQVGDHITPAQRFMEIIDTQQLKLESRIPARYSTQLAIQMPVNIRLPYLQKQFKGKVTSIFPMIDSQSNTIAFTAIVEPNQGLIPGSFANGTLALTKQKVLIIPKKVISYSGTSYVFVVEKNKAHKIPIEWYKLPGNPKMAVVVSGLKRGMLTIWSKNVPLRDGQLVRLRQKE